MDKGAGEEDSTTFEFGQCRHINEQIPGNPHVRVQWYSHMGMGRKLVEQQHESCDGSADRFHSVKFNTVEELFFPGWLYLENGFSKCC